MSIEMDFRVLRSGIAAMALTLLITGCGGGGGGSSDSNTAKPGTGGNSKPTISGTPGPTAVQNFNYNFQPSASDADGDALTFSIENKPGWAGFNSSTGRLNGMPSASDLGTFSNIGIGVSDGTDSTSLPNFSIGVFASGTGVATLTWTPPTENTDGSVLTNLAGYKIYYGMQDADFDTVMQIDPGLSTYMIEQLPPATWYFTMTAITDENIESVFSNIATKTTL